MRLLRAASVLAVGLGCNRTETSAAAAGTPATVVDTPAAAVVEIDASNIKRDEVVAFIPTFATRTRGTWSIPIDAWVYEPEDDGLGRRAVLAALREVIEIPTGDAEAEHLVEAIRPFLVDNEGDKHVVVRWKGGAAEICETHSNGRCRGTVELQEHEVGLGAVWKFNLVLPEDDSRSFAGEVLLLTDSGVSVISDIDDTIKVTGCHDKAELLRNTLLREFVPAPNLAAVYQRWAKQGAAFHYVSNSPLPLLGALTEFIADQRLPRGAIRLKPFRFKDGSFVDLLAAPEDHKQGVLEEIVGQFAVRRFVLIGDTGERDPEIYAALARKFPERIAKIYLRDPLGGTPGLDARMQATFEGLPPTLWSVFTDATPIADDLP